MKILVLNGSPKRANSNTMRLTTAFLAGFDPACQNDIHIVSLYDLDIAPCAGCFACWVRTPGTCALRDDMASLLERYRAADLVIWSFPLYYYGLPARAKGVLDRLLPLNLPDLIPREGGGVTHPQRGDASPRKQLIISTCGFPSVENNYEALITQFHLAFIDQTDRIFCPEGELFSIPELQRTVSAYLSAVEQAGEEYARSGRLSPETTRALSVPIVEPDTFMELANAQWRALMLKNGVTNSSSEGEPRDITEPFMRQMKALYNPRFTPDAPVVLEIYYTDYDRTYQFQISDGTCRLTAEPEQPYTTRIETPFTVWKGIAEGSVNRIDALLDHRYRVLGDFSIMLRFGEIFSIPAISDRPGPAEKRSNLLMLALPWLLLWSITPYHTMVGAVAAILSGLLLLADQRYARTPYELVTGFAAPIFGIALLLGGPPDLLLPAGRAFWAGMWLVSVFRKVPLCAYYSCHYYGMGGPAQAFANRLFLRTNRIVAALWGIHGVFQLAVQLLVQPSVLRFLLHSVPSVALALFSLWFAGWYPARIARGPGK